MEYGSKKYGKIIELSLNLQKINEAINPDTIYLSYDLETLKNYLNSAKKFPKEILSKNKNIGEMVLSSIGLIEKAIEIHNEKKEFFRSNFMLKNLIN